MVLDTDLAMLHGESTKRFNKQYERNRSRVPLTVCFS
ncbi:MAG: hypothetical protein H6929_07680 [Rhodoferax sp.]|nr:hypothetical protein [Rhodoferax sp.]MCW5628897.1 hypothetical protein [Rhodoferax sp.]